MVNTLQKDISNVKRISAVPTILEVICRATGMGFAAVARVTEDRWIACDVRDDIQFGLKSGGELKVETTLCHEIRQSQQAVVIDHVAQDARYCGHPTAAMYGFQSYISMPIMLPGERFFGTLCAIDPNPARVNTPETIGMFKLFAELISFHLNAIEQLESSESSLSEAREQSELREQFIAVLGHDLRNPLGAVTSGAALLLRTPLNERGIQLATTIQGCAARMSELIENVLDFARGRLGNGLTLDHIDDAPLEPALRHVIDELRVNWPNRVIDAQFTLAAPVWCNHRRIAQLFSNLLGNALTYGTASEPVRVRATCTGQAFELSVANGGTPIPLAVQARLFEPFSRGEDKSYQQGLGLGLYIATEIARAHKGTLGVSSTVEETRFTLRIPAKA